MGRRVRTRLGQKPHGAPLAPVRRPLSKVLHAPLPGLPDPDDVDGQPEEKVLVSRKHRPFPLLRAGVGGLRGVRRELRQPLAEGEGALERCEARLGGEELLGARAEVLCAELELDKPWGGWDWGGRQRDEAGRRCRGGGLMAGRVGAGLGSWRALGDRAD